MSYKSKVEKRRRLPIVGYVGTNGSGKSLAAVADTVASLQAGRPVLSSLILLDPETGLPHPLWVPLVEYRQLLTFSGGDLLLDEVQGIVSSRGSQGLHGSVVNALLQMRRRDVVIRWTSPSYQRADIVLREVTQAVTVCNAYCHREVPGKMWREARVFRWRTYDGQSMVEFHARQADPESRVAPKRLLQQWWWLRDRGDDLERSPHRWYATGAEVLSIRDLGLTGRCLDCGGRRRAPPCKCDQADGASAPEHWSPSRKESLEIAYVAGITRPAPDPDGARSAPASQDQGSASGTEQSPDLQSVPAA